MIILWPLKAWSKPQQKSIEQNKNEIHRRHIDGHKYVIKKNNFCDKKNNN